MVDTQFIERRIYEKTPTARTSSALKVGAGCLFVDVRKWFRWPDHDEFYPTKMGLMLSVDDWDHVLPQIQELIDIARGKSRETISNGQK